MTNIIKKLQIIIFIKNQITQLKKRFKEARKNLGN